MNDCPDSGRLAAVPGDTCRRQLSAAICLCPSARRLTFTDLERCVALAVLDHNLRQNEKTLIAPFAEWTAHSAELPRRDDDPLQVLIAFLPGGERRLGPPPL